jgi:hypothetical protein
MSEITYPYSQGDRLEDRNTYFYSSYHGAAFFPVWRASRDAALSHLPPPRSQPVLAPAANKGAEDGHDTEQLLRNLLAGSPENAENRRLAERLLQRFEVSKRIYRRYDPQFKTMAESGYAEVELYLLFASLCLHYSKQPESLPYLNALLKVLDTLVSILHRLSPTQGAYLAWLIGAEREWVARIAARVSVDIEPV